MTPTLSTSGFLYKVHRNRQQYLTAIEKRRAVWYCVGIVACIIAAVVIVYV